MNLFTKTTPWAVASLLAAATVFGDDKCKPQKSYEQDQKMTQAQMMPGYDATARIDVRGAWDFYVDGSFIYWQMLQDNMEVAFVDTLTNTSYIGATSGTEVAGNFAQTDFQYKPGFKVAVGMNFDLDHWDSRSEYTMLHSQVSTTTNGGLSSVDDSQLPVFNTVGVPAQFINNAYDTVSNKWRSNLDIGDIDLGRTYHVGMNLSFRTAFGARAAWIRQSLTTSSVNLSFAHTQTATSPVAQSLGTLSTSDRTHSWALGPRAKVMTNWLIGQGIRFYGVAGADVLYTKYHLQTKASFLPSATVANNNVVTGVPITNTSTSRSMALRTHVDMELGLGWGSYFDNNNWHIDLSAGYGFQVFFDQNMFQNQNGAFSPATAKTSNGNLYAQGLTANMRIDF